MSCPPQGSYFVTQPVTPAALSLQVPGPFELSRRTLASASPPSLVQGVELCLAALRILWGKYICS